MDAPTGKELYAVIDIVEGVGRLFEITSDSVRARVAARTIRGVVVTLPVLYDEQGG